MRRREGPKQADAGFGAAISRLGLEWEGKQGVTRGESEEAEQGSGCGRGVARGVAGRSAAILWGGPGRRRARKGGASAAAREAWPGHLEAGPGAGSGSQEPGSGNEEQGAGSWEPGRAAAAMSTVDLARVGACILKHAVTGEVRPGERRTVGASPALARAPWQRWGGGGRGAGAGLGAVGRAPDPAAWQAVELRSLWRDRACVVAGLRRFGCVVCRWIAQDLSGLTGLLDQHGVRLVGVGPEALGLQEFLDGGYFAGGASCSPTRGRRHPSLNSGLSGPFLAQPWLFCLLEWP